MKDIVFRIYGNDVEIEANDMIISKQYRGEVLYRLYRLLRNNKAIFTRECGIICRLVYSVK